jgi:signal transduction histidine kinase
VPTPVGSACYRIVQEALTNVLRHANARTVTVDVRADEDMLTIVVADNGTDAGRPSTGAGAGLRGMRERAEALGGRCSAGPGADGGFAVAAELPL